MFIRDGWQGHTGVLSPREVEFTLAVAAGLTDKQIAREAGVAPDSVRKRVYSAMFKLGASRRAHLVAEAIRRAIITPLVIMLAVCCISAASQIDSGQERAPRNQMTRNSRQSRREDLLFNPFDYV